MRGRCGRQAFYLNDYRGGFSFRMKHQALSGNFGGGPARPGATPIPARVAHFRPPPRHVPSRVDIGCVSSDPPKGKVAPRADGIGEHPGLGDDGLCQREQSETSSDPVGDSIEGPDDIRIALYEHHTVDDAGPISPVTLILGLRLDEFVARNVDLGFAPAGSNGSNAEIVGAYRARPLLFDDATVASWPSGERKTTGASAILRATFISSAGSATDGGSGERFDTRTGKGPEIRFEAICWTAATCPVHKLASRNHTIKHTLLTVIATYIIRLMVYSATVFASGSPPGGSQPVRAAR